MQVKDIARLLTHNYICIKVNDKFEYYTQEDVPDILGEMTVKGLYADDFPFMCIVVNVDTP